MSTPLTHLLLVDGSAYIFRAFHALPPLTRKSDGMPIGAVSGFCNMVWKLLNEQIAGDRPSHLAVIFDASSETFRNQIYDQYKAHRPEVPEDLRPQFGLVRDATRAFNLPSIEKIGFEADDLIATYARLAEEAGARVTIISSDKDLMQLVTDKVSMYDPMKDKIIGAAEVFEKFGVAPDKVIDVQALAGDASDNVPGVPGIGLKTGAQLITEYGSLEELLARTSEIKQPKRREALETNAELARISKRLVTLEAHVPLDDMLDSFALHQPEPEKLIQFLREMGFNTLTKRIADKLGASAMLDAPMAEKAKIAGEMGGALKEATSYQSVSEMSDNKSIQQQSRMDELPLSQQRKAALSSLPIVASQYKTITSLSDLEVVISQAKQVGYLSVDTETTSLDAMQAELVGISLSCHAGEAYYIPLAHKTGEDSLFGAREVVAGQLDSKAVLARLKPVLEDPALLKIGQNIKYDYLLLSRYNIHIAPYDDTMLISYVLDNGKNGHGMDELSELHLNHKPIAFKDVCGSGKSSISFDSVTIEKATEYAAEDADVTLRLWLLLKPRLAEEAMLTVYETLERGMAACLARMEAHGISIDRHILSRLSGEFAQTMARLEHEVHQLTGEPFNLGSPKQLGDLLFGKMGLPGAKKTPTGAWATGAQVLEELAEAGHELPARILDWRQLAKLKSTYTDALPQYVNPETKRVHTSFALASTSTGRLSSSEPNIQNIPVRSAEGRKIREAFIAVPGTKLISADYSQIELRILAHIAEIPQLKAAFASGLDIHAMTASEMFNVPLSEMTSDIRRRAKAINFGIIYGISAFGLANQLGIGREEASAYIKKYFERFPGIRDYMEDTKAFVKANGYVETIFGRKCHYPMILQSRSASERAFLERAAINAPIQGSAADIIRRAMLRMEGALHTKKLSAKMLLQVHDELIFEVPESEVEASLPIIRKVMIDAPEPALKLSVPLQVDARAADNWDAAH